MNNIFPIEVPLPRTDQDLLILDQEQTNQSVDSNAVPNNDENELPFELFRQTSHPTNQDNLFHQREYILYRLDIAFGSALLVIIRFYH